MSDNNVFYFIQIDRVITGPYPIRKLVENLAAGKIDLYTRCSADKAKWEALCDILFRHGVDWKNIVRNVEIKKPQVVVEKHFTQMQPVAGDGLASPAEIEEENAASFTFWNAVAGILWHPGRQLAALAGREKQALIVALTYQILLATVVVIGRNLCVLHRNFHWKMLWFAPWETVAVFAVAALSIGLFALLFADDGKNGKATMLAIAGGALIGGTWGLSLFLLTPGRFFPWTWCEYLALVFLGGATFWSSAAMTVWMIAWGETRPMVNRYVAGVFAVLMMLGIAALHFFLIALYKEF